MSVKTLKLGFFFYDLGAAKAGLDTLMGPTEDLFIWGRPGILLSGLLTKSGTKRTFLPGSLCKKKLGGGGHTQKCIIFFFYIWLPIYLVCLCH